MVKLKRQQRHEALLKMQSGFKVIGKNTNRIDMELESISKGTFNKNSIL